LKVCVDLIKFKYMVKISSDDVTGMTKAFAFVPLVALILIIAVTSFEIFHSDSSPIIPLVLVAALILMIWSLKKFTWSLADEVYDDGDKLVIKRSKDVHEILLSDIENIFDRSFSRPPKITVDLVEDGVFGPSISFIPIDSGALSNYFRNGIATGLSLRINKVKADYYKKISEN
jgi:nitrogen fixation-related uncharacterized protein